VADVNPHHERLLESLLHAPRLTAADLDSVARLQGVYVWWLGASRSTCLKVGRALLGARNEGLRRRIGQHLSSNPDNTVFARHLAADKTSDWAAGVELEERRVRQLFLAERCQFQVLPLPDLTQPQLDAFEGFVEEQLKPRYIDYVRA